MENKPETTPTAGQILKDSVPGNLWRQIETSSSSAPTPPSEPSKPKQPNEDLNRGIISLSENPEKMFRLDPTHPGATELIQAGAWFLTNLFKNDGAAGKRLAISGSTGAGKSHLAHRIRSLAGAFGPDLIVAHGLTHWSTLWIDWAEVADANNEEHYKNRVDEMKNASLVVFDDIGAETDRYKSGVPSARLRTLLEDCKNKWTVITTNLSQKDTIALYDGRVADRLRAFHWVELGEVPSYRAKLKGGAQ